MTDLSQAMLIVASFTLAGFMQMVWLRSRLFAKLRYPIDFGIKFGDATVFGPNKTWAGFCGMVLFTFVVFFCIELFLQSLAPEVLSAMQADLRPGMTWGELGLWAGLGYMVGELPNSFIKRRLGIAPGTAGKTPFKKHFFQVVDQCDSILGGLLAVRLCLPLGLPALAVSFVTGTFIHWLFNVLLFRLGMKSRAA